MPARGLGLGSYVEFWVIEQVFGPLGLKKLWCEVLVSNEPVWRLHMKHGFVEEARFRRHVLKDGAWLRHAAHANAMAQRLQEQLKSVGEVTILFEAQANAVFADIPPHVIAALRKSGVPAWFTCDAGPHPKALTDAANAERVAHELSQIPGVLRTRICAPGPNVRIVE